MRATLTTVLLLSAALAGCATTSASNASAADAQPTKAKTQLEVDTAKMAAVDRAAREMGIAVHWVNPPVKRTAR